MTGLMAGALLSALPLCARAALSRDDSYDIEGAMRQVLGERKAMPGRITLDAPKLAGSGNSVPLTVRVDSPMSAAEYVRRIHVFATRNPRPHVMSVQLNPHSGRAEFSTHIRLSGTQAVAVFAEMSDTTLWSAEALIDVTVGACESLMFRF
jgi:sulfur-oxidizing protein SoxY